MHRLLNAVFANVDILGPHVRDGRFYLEDSDGYQLVPELWDDLIRPGMDITMAMWSMDKLPPPKSSILPGGPPQPTNPEEPSQRRKPLTDTQFQEFLFGKPAKKVHKDKNQPPQAPTRSRLWNDMDGEQPWYGNWRED